MGSTTTGRSNPAAAAATPSHCGRDLLILCGLCLLLLGPFLNRPFHVDDPAYVWVARQIKIHPADYYGFHLNWVGHDQMASDFFESPPMVCYLIAGIALVAGNTEALTLHAGFLPLNLLSAIGCYLLARRFCRRPLLAAMLLVLCPAFAVSATTVMCEPLLIFCWMWGILLWIWGCDRNAWYLPAAAIIALAAILTKYLSLALLPLLILYAVLRPASKKVRWIQLLSLLIPILGAAGYEAISRHLYGQGGFGAAASFVADKHNETATPLAITFLDTLCFVGGSASAVMFLLPLVFNRYLTLGLAVLGAAIAVLAAHNFLPPEGWQPAAADSSRTNEPSFAIGIGYYSQAAFWMIGGVGIIGLAIERLVSSIRHKRLGDETFLTVWIGGVFLFAGFFNWAINARSILPMLPAVCILGVRRLDSVSILPRLRVGMVVAVSVPVTVMVMRADYLLACTIKQAAAQVSEATAAFEAKDNAKHSVWFAGHWGFQYYMEQAGARPIDDREPRLKPGDYIIYPNGKYGGTAKLQGLTHLQHIEVGEPRWVANEKPLYGESFYASFGYGLPFVFRPIPPESFEIVRVTPQTTVRP